MKRLVWIGLVALATGCGSKTELPTCKDGQTLKQQGAEWACVDALTPPAVNALAQAQLNCTNGEVPIFGASGWACGAVTSTNGGDIDAVHPGAGLTGGADTGTATLAVDFAGTGSANTVAHSDHTHSFLELTNLPPGFADMVDNDALGSLSCTDQQVPRFNALNAAWECWTPTSGGGTFTETDPTVNSLAKSGVDACTSGQVPVRAGSGWACLTPQDRDTVAALGCGDSQVPQFNASTGNWGCVSLPNPGDPNAINEVATGAGLVSSRDGGSVSLAVDFGASCASGKVACSDQIVPPVTPTLAQVVAQGNDASNTRISNVGAPIAGSDAVTKSYVDALAAGGSPAMSLAICCGPNCSNSLPGWHCDTNNADGGLLVIPMPDSRGVIEVPGSGSPVILAATPPTALPDGGILSGSVTLNSCSSNWNVCTQTGYSAALLTCGLFQTSAGPNPWTCTAPPQAYIIVPTMKGILYVSGQETNNEYLDDVGHSASPASLIDCSGAAPFPGPGTKTGICFR